MKSLKPRQQLTEIILKGWIKLYTTASVSEISEIVKSQEFIIIDGLWFNKYEVKTFDKYILNEIDCLVLSQERKTREKLEKELAIRRERKLKINIWVIQNILNRI